MPLFTLEAVRAKHGDSLILHYGPENEPRFILIDGGPPGVYQDFLRPRLEEIRERWPKDGALPLEMVMVSHIDADHIDGILDLTDELIENEGDRLCDIGVLWHNSFDEVVGNREQDLVSKLPKGLVKAASLDQIPGEFEKGDRFAAAIAASVTQGRKLRRNAERLGLPVNDPFVGLVSSDITIQGKPTTARFNWGDGLTLTVLGPGRKRIEELHKKWEAELKKKGPLAAIAAGYEDTSPYNLSSIVVLAESGGKRMLLTGDARGDYILTALEEAGLLEKGGEDVLKVDLLKMPHHGSHHNVEAGFFQRIIADHYVISGDGGYGNPEEEALNMIVDSREDDAFTIWMTYRDGREGLKEKLDKFLAARKKKKRTFDVKFCPDEENSLKIDLLEKVGY
jgi:hypothetical protein